MAARESAPDRERDAIVSRPALRDAIIEHLRQAGSDSISGITRHLSALEGAPVHRLTIAGYLAGMADEGVLKEVDRPPSKHYQLSDEDQHITLHQRVGRIVASMNVPAPERATLTVAVLEHILDRPIFSRELAHAGYEATSPGLQVVEAGDGQRRGYRALFRRRHALDLDIPRGDDLVSARTGAVRPGMIQEVMRRAILSGLPGVDRLILPKEAQASVQTQLAVDEP